VQDRERVVMLPRQNRRQRQILGDKILGGLLEVEAVEDAVLGVLRHGGQRRDAAAMTLGETAVDVCAAVQRARR